MNILSRGLVNLLIDDILNLNINFNYRQNASVFYLRTERLRKASLNHIERAILVKKP